MRWRRRTSTSSTTDGSRTASHGGFDVAYCSPAEGDLRLDVTRRPVRRRASRCPIDGYPRFDNPFVQAAEGEAVLRITDDVGGFVLDLAAGTRSSVR